MACEFEVEEVAEAAFEVKEEVEEGTEPDVDVDFVPEEVVVAVLEPTGEVDDALIVAREV